MCDIKMKKCPICGNSVDLCMDDYGKFMVMCAPCGLYFGIEVEMGVPLVDGWRAKLETEEKAIEAWNRRATNENM